MATVEVKKKICPLMKDVCKKEECAWWITPDANFGKPDCAIVKIGYEANKNIHNLK